MRTLLVVILLFFALTLGWLGLTAVRAVGALADPQTLAQALPWTWIRDRVLLPQAREQMAGLAGRFPPQHPVQWVVRALNQADESTWREMIDALLPPDRAQALWVETWPSLWKSLTHPAAGSQEISLTPWKEQLTQGIGPALQVLLDALPACDFQENLALAQAALARRWDTAPLCRPPRTVLDAFWPQVVVQAQEAIAAALPETLPLHRLLPPEALAALRRLFVLVPLIGWGLVGLAGVLALVGVALAGAGRWAWLGGASLTFGGGLWAIAHYGGDLGWRWVASLLPRSPDLPLMLGQTVWPGLWQAMWNPVLPWAWGMMGVGLVLFLGGLLLRPR